MHPARRCTDVGALLRAGATALASAAFVVIVAAAFLVANGPNRHLLLFNGALGGGLLVTVAAMSLVLRRLGVPSRWPTLINAAIAFAVFGTELWHQLAPADWSPPVWIVLGVALIVPWEIAALGFFERLKRDRAGRGG